MNTDSPSVLIVIDSFKGTLKAAEAAAAVAEGCTAVCPKARITSFPSADGGEGSSTLMGELMGARKIEIPVVGPDGKIVEGFYYLRAITAYIELAAASGYSLVGNKTPEMAERATSYGTGQLIRSAINKGAEDILLFLGGSATTDAGVGMAKALGAEFYDAAGTLMPGPLESKETQYPGERLADIASISLKNLCSGQVRISAAADVENPLFGKTGAAHIFGPQKGADEATIDRLDKGLRHFADIARKTVRRDYSMRPGAGAAGGTGFSILALLDGEILPGSQFFLDLISFDEQARNADIIITGEGRIDEQSMHGKLVSEVLRRAEVVGCPVLALCGSSEITPAQLNRHPAFRLHAMGEAGLVEPYGTLRATAESALRAHLQLP